MHTALDYLRVISAVAVGCGVYDTVMYTVARTRAKQLEAKMRAEYDAIVKRVEELKTKAEGAVKP